MTHSTARTKLLRRVPYSLDDRPFIVIWEVTRACQLVCRHCRAEAIPDRNPAELSTDEAIRLFDDLASFGRPAPLLVLTGGDPFERPDLTELVAAATARRIPVSLAPSVTANVTRERLAELYAAGAKAVSLSLDGIDAATHDGFRGVEGVFDATLTAARWVTELGYKLQINTTVTPDSLPQLPDIAGRVRGLGASLWSLFFLVPTGRGHELAGLSPEEVEDVLHFCYDTSKYLSVKATEAPHFRRVIAQRDAAERAAADGATVDGWDGGGPTYRRLRRRLVEVLGPAPAREGVRRPPLDVNAGRGFVFVSHVGVVQPSGFLPLPVGSVREQSLVDIYRDAPLLRALRDPSAFDGRCGRCEWAATCGGSRSRAYAVTGDPLADEPTCILVKNHAPLV